MDENTRIFITGATGFIGRFLVQELLAQGYADITAMARPTSNVGFLKSRGIRIITQDITDSSLFDNIKETYDVVFHCAGFVSDGANKALDSVNIRGTESICRWAIARKVKKFIYLSSVSVNSGNTEIPLTEELPYIATNRYGISKLEAEKIAVRFKDSGLPMVIVRPCMVYGEGEPHMMRLLLRLIKLRLLLIPNRGKAKLHLVSVRNLAACLLRCMEDNRALGKIFNVADKEVLTTREVIEALSAGLKAPTPILLPYFLTKVFTFIPVIGKRIKFLCKDRVYSIEKLFKILDFTPPYEAKTELIRTAASF